MAVAATSVEGYRVKWFAAAGGKCRRHADVGGGAGYDAGWVQKEGFKVRLPK